jgi:hypothetical protein
MSTHSTTKTISTLLLTLIAIPTTQSHPLLLLLQITVPTCSKPLLL